MMISLQPGVRVIISRQQLVMGAISPSPEPLIDPELR
jgi:hypothetical protein